MDDLSNYSYDADWREPVELSDGTHAVLRLIRPADKELLKTGFEQLSTESRYRRFLGAKTGLSDKDLDYLCDIDNVDHIAIGALEAESGRGLGVARCIRLKGEDEVAEAAVTVIDECQGKGLGRALLTHLVRAAVERDVRRFRNTLFAQNKPMRALIDDLGGDVEIVERTGPVMTIESKLPTPDELGMDSESRRTRPLYRALRMAAEGAFSVIERLRNAGRALRDRGNDSSEET